MVRRSSKLYFPTLLFWSWWILEENERQNPAAPCFLEDLEADAGFEMSSVESVQVGIHSDAVRYTMPLCMTISTHCFAASRGLPRNPTRHDRHGSGRLSVKGQLGVAMDGSEIQGSHNQTQRKKMKKGVKRKTSASQSTPGSFLRLFAMLLMEVA